MDLLFNDVNKNIRSTLSPDSFKIKRIQQDFDESDDVFLIDDNGNKIMDAGLSLPNDKAWIYLNRAHCYKKGTNGVLMNLSDIERLNAYRVFFKMLFDPMQVKSLRAFVFTHINGLNISEDELQKIGFFWIKSPSDSRYVFLNPNFKTQLGYYTSDPHVLESCSTEYSRLKAAQNRYVEYQREQLEIVHLGLDDYKTEENYEGINTARLQQNHLQEVLANFEGEVQINKDH